MSSHILIAPQLTFEPKSKSKEIINKEALRQCILRTVRADLQEHFRIGCMPPSQDERLLCKQELATELGVPLSTLYQLTAALIFLNSLGVQPYFDLKTVEK